MTDKDRLEEIKRNFEVMTSEEKEWLIEQAERVEGLDSFKSSVEYTVDSETLELIINNQDSENVLKMSETYDEKIFMLLQQNKRYREAIEKSIKDLEEDINIVDCARNAHYRLSKTLEGEE